MRLKIEAVRALLLKKRAEARAKDAKRDKERLKDRIRIERKNLKRIKVFLAAPKLEEYEHSDTAGLYDHQIASLSLHEGDTILVSGKNSQLGKLLGI